MLPWGSYPSERRTTRPSAWAFLQISRLPSPSCARAGASKWTLAWPLPKIRFTKSVGLGEGDEVSTPFLEVCSVGLVSDLFPSADDIQHGNLARVGDFLATLVSSPPAEIHLVLDGKQEIHSLGHVVLVSNMPVIGLHYRVGEADSFNDGLLDVLFFADLSKLDLLGYIFQGVGTGGPEDPRIQHYRVRRVDIDTHPAMAVMADGNALGEGPVRIEVRRRVLAVMVGIASARGIARPGHGHGVTDA